jgi:hypothetical protein
LFQKADELTTPEEIEETCTTVGESLGSIISDLINFK